MTLSSDELRDSCLAKPGGEMDEPREGDLVATVGGKLFASLGSGEAVRDKLGNSRDEADEGIARYRDDGSASAHIGRHGWNLLQLGGRIPTEAIMAAVGESYDRIVAGLPRSRRP